jgi:murein DD-endopeptidase MepM/ murein hydrolase activator NlpD
LREKRYVQVAGARVSALCSEKCLLARIREQKQRRSAKRRRRAKRLFIAGALLGACIAPHDGPPPPRKFTMVPAYARAREEPPSLSPAGPFAADWPPSEASLVAELGRDAWLHPLPGPFRRMPSHDSRVFGADRPGDRPIECRRGHCGVDLGGDIWGEYVHAAHDGVVDRVQRATNDQHGGHYVRLSHRGGTVFTQYFHLAAIPRHIEAGVAVKAGELIGLLGDTGVKESTAHLHFTVSVRPAPELPEVYVDPEPLVALWPLRIPIQRSTVSVVSAAGKPGVPLGGAPVGSRRQKVVKREPTRKQAPSTAMDTSKPPPATANEEPTSEPSAD